MSPENNQKDENFISSGRKADQAVKCPRCDSPNTKFCYYNNYSLSQPRHFCKTCRRYWTKGGALRNVPIGGGCRKNKKVKSSLRFSGCVDSKESGANSDNSEFGAKLGFFNGHSPATMDFNLGTRNLSFSRIDPFGVFPAGVDMNIASSIESLSSLNQNLHWKLQQQRLTNSMQPILFQNLEISKPEVVCDSSSAVPDQWFFGNSYAAAATTTATMTDNMRGDAVGSFDSGGGGFDGVQEWNDLHQFSHLP